MRRAYLALFTVLLTYLAVELLALGGFWILDGEPFSFARVSIQRQAVLEREAEPPPSSAKPPDVWHGNRIFKFIPHPFMGAIQDPTQGPAYHWWIRRVTGDSLDEPNTAYVAVTGGSVAANLLRRAWPTLRRKLEKIPRFRSKTLSLIDLSSVGGKQPQQLMAVNYFLALGGRIDVLINLDGFNEIGLELLNNVRYGIFPAYPWTWVPLTMQYASQADLARLGDIRAWRKLRTGFALGLDPVGFSVTANLLWRSIDNALQAAEYGAQEARMNQARIPMASRGPVFDGDEADAFAFSVDIWSNASLSLQHLADGHGFEYFHFLQPNQYVDGSKPFTPRERSEYRRRKEILAVVSRWYPVLRERGAALSEQGVGFYDLTRIFVDNTTQIYIDDCCHLVERGNRILASEIADVITADLTSDPQPPPSRNHLRNSGRQDPGP